MPLVRICDISKDVEADELIEDLRSYNDFMENFADVEIRVAFWRNSFVSSRFGDAILVVPPELHKVLTDNKKLKISCQQVRVSKFSRFTQCGFCLKFGHSSKVCKKKDLPVCGWCSKNHKTSDCKKETDPVCYNCSEHNKILRRDQTKLDVSHEAVSSYCPLLQRAKKVAEWNTNYAQNGGEQMQE